jgi:CheY-like chemotaxis protein
MRRAGDEPMAIAQVRDTLDRQVEQLSRIIEDLIDVSRIVKRKISLKKERVPVASIVETALETCRSSIEVLGHQLTVSMPPDPPYLEGDPARLSQGLVNVLQNAAKFTDSGGHIWLTVETVAGPKERASGQQGPGEQSGQTEGQQPAAASANSEVVISVRDTGTGIHPDLLPRVFDMFTQGDRTIERRRGGLGIGLTLTRSVVEMHGGSIEAHSAGVGQGSEFVMRLPAVSKPPPPAPEHDAPSPEMRPRKRILVVDDNYDQAKTMNMLLSLMGHEICLAHDGPGAIEAAISFQPDVALIDIGLPGMNGYDVARRLREMPQFQDTVLVAQTGWGQEEDRLRSIEAGFDHHVVKPANLDLLQEIIASPR